MQRLFTILSLLMPAIFAGMTSIALSDEVKPVAKVLDTSVEGCKKFAVNQTYGGPMPTKIFYVFSEMKAILKVTIGNQDKNFPISAQLHLFADATTQENLDRWINNQHSDGLFPDVAEPVKTHDIPATSCKVLSKKSDKITVEREADYEHFLVEFQLKDIAPIDGITIKDFTDNTTVLVKLK